MGLFRRMRHIFHEDWCSECLAEMEVTRRQLYAMPEQQVGHYVPHDDAGYYQKTLIPVRKKAEIPTGIYACGLTEYRCPMCGHRAVKASVFLPVREEEKLEQVLYFDHGELLAWPDGRENQ